MANIKILVVDDDENICELLRLYLEKDGYDVQIALDGEAALEKFRHYNPDLILLDIIQFELVYFSIVVILSDSYNQLHINNIDILC